MSRLGALNFWISVILIAVHTHLTYFHKYVRLGMLMSPEIGGNGIKVSSFLIIVHTHPTYFHKYVRLGMLMSADIAQNNENLLLR